MPQRTDGTKFAAVPLTVLYDNRLTLQARAVYAILLNEVWQRRPDRRARIFGVPVQLPTQDDLAAMAGLSLAAFKKHLGALRREGYVEVSRSHRQQPLTYSIRDVPTVSGEVVPDPSQVDPDRADTTELGGRAGDVSRAGGSLLVVRENYERGPFGSIATDPDGSVDWSAVGKPPELPKDDRGHVEAIDALQIICGIDSASRQRMKEVAVALHGTRNVNDQPGINRLFWLECARGFGASLEVIRDRAAANPTGYQSLLVAAIQRRAAQYQQRLRGAELTPGALAKWWLDLERGPGGSDRPLTPDEIERL